MASVNCLASGVDHLRSSSFLTAVAVKPRQLWHDLQNGAAALAFELLASPRRAARITEDLMLVYKVYSWLDIAHVIVVLSGLGQWRCRPGRGKGELEQL